MDAMHLPSSYSPKIILEILFSIIHWMCRLHPWDPLALDIWPQSFIFDDEERAKGNWIKKRRRKGSLGGVGLGLVRKGSLSWVISFTRKRKKEEVEWSYALENELGWDHMHEPISWAWVVEYVSTISSQKMMKSCTKVTVILVFLCWTSSSKIPHCFLFVHVHGQLGHCWLSLLMCSCCLLCFVLVQGKINSRFSSMN